MGHSPNCQQHFHICKTYRKCDWSRKLLLLTYCYFLTNHILPVISSIRMTLQCNSLLWFLAIMSDCNVYMGRKVYKKPQRIWWNLISGGKKNVKKKLFCWGVMLAEIPSKSGFCLHKSNTLQLNKMNQHWLNAYYFDNC